MAQYSKEDRSITSNESDRQEQCTTTTMTKACGFRFCITGWKSPLVLLVPLLLPPPPLHHIPMPWWPFKDV